MQLSKLEFLSKQNNLLTLALKPSPEFPGKLSEFLIEEFELQAVVFFSFTDDNRLKVLSSAGDTKKIYSAGANFSCTHCKNLKNKLNDITFDTEKECEIQASEFIINEGCLYLHSSEFESLLIKIAQKKPFSKTDIENFETAGRLVLSLYKVWKQHGGSESASVCRIISDIAHELRTPTNSIMGFASLLSEDKLSTSQSEYVATLKENAYNLLALTNDLIDLAKIESETSKPILSSVNLKSLLEEAAKVFTGKAELNKISFLFDIDKKLPDTVKIDAQKLRTILVNILNFSLRNTEKGSITISAALNSNTKIEFKISDTGSGFPTSKAKDLFKPFAAAGLGNQKIGNMTGLGLTLSKSYVELLGGIIEASTTPGKGTSFSFTINAEVMNKIEEQISTLPKSSSKKNRVLVVEDDYATSKLLSSYLNKWGYEPVIVNSADQALKEIEKEIFLAVLMDIVLPDANGFELLKNIREHKNTKNTPVIICSVEAEQQKAFMMGAVEYFVKPIKYKYLVEVLTSYKLKKDSNILIVDDDIPTLNLIKSAVEQAGYNAIADSDSAKVSRDFESMNLDLAIIDLDMPEVNGFDLIKQIKSKPKFAKLPVIIYTGKENYQDDLKKIDGMFADLLHKNSSNIEDLADVITSMINRYDEPSQPEELKSKPDTIKILLVEDYKHSQIIVTRLLKKNNFESIVVVENGLEALEQAKQQQYDLILMDMQMPVMNGFEATEKIRQLPEYKSTPIIALTAFAMKGDREKCIEAGATDYIPKPIDSQEFIEKVKYYTSNVPA
jgi:CheY-like chemotaxis protein/two-component sensor histidine kinase